MRFSVKNCFHYGVAASAILVLTTSCGKKKSSDDDAATPAAGSALSLTGTLSLSATTASTSLTDDIFDRALGLVALSDDKLNCTVFSDPPVYKSAAFNSDGSFSLDLAGTGYPVGCDVVDSSGSRLAAFVFKGSRKDLSGNSAKDTKVALNGSAALGAISANADSGTAVIDTSTISNLATAAVANAFDFTGSWSMDKADVLPSGYTAPCTQDEAKAAQAANKQTCNGPTIGESIWIKRLNGKTTSDASSTYAVEVWKSEDSFKACGSKLGFSYADAKSKAGIDLTDSGVAEGAFSWTDGWVDGWKLSSAKNGSWAMQDCSQTTYKGKEAYKCNASDGKYTISLPGGCMGTASGKPVQVENWSSITGMSNTTETDSATGLTRNITTGSYNGTAIKCVNVFGSFNTDGSSYTGQVTPQTLVAANATCSSIAETSDTLKLAKLRCYSNGYWSAGEGAANVCIRKVDFDWTATDPTKFLSNSDGPQQARNQHVLSLLNYTDANTASLHDEHQYYRGVQVNGNMVNCMVREAFTMTLRRTSDTKVTAEFVSETKSVDQGKPACVAGLSDSVIKNFMVLNKK